MSDALTRELDDAFLAIVADWSAGGVGCDEDRFEELALAMCAYQLKHNVPYARYAASLGIDVAQPPRRWRDIPAVPASAFKDATLATFPAQQAELTFYTSGTTADVAGKHYIEHARLYDAALLAGFDRFMLDDGAASDDVADGGIADGARLQNQRMIVDIDAIAAHRPKLRYLNLLPNPRFHPHSSLGYMMGHVSVLRGDGKAQYFIEDHRGSQRSTGEPPGSARSTAEPCVDVDEFARAVERAIADAQPVCVAGTAFALVALLDGLEREQRQFVCPRGSRIMETGGFKGRARAVERTQLYARLEAALGIVTTSIVAEYGMTELVSQYYDAPESRAADRSEPGAARAQQNDHACGRVKRAPPWLRTLVVNGDGREVPHGKTGFLRHLDLGNRSSVVAIETEDRGYACGEGIVLLGRALDAPLRGCSLDAEDLIARKQ